jgi:two-component system response regulator
MAIWIFMGLSSISLLCNRFCQQVFRALSQFAVAVGRKSIESPAVRSLLTDHSLHSIAALAARKRVGPLCALHPLIGYYESQYGARPMRRIVEILVVDDSEEDAALTMDALRTAVPDVAVLRLIDGEQALHFICATDGYAGRPPGLPKLVLLDMHMPGMDGIAVLQALRARPDTQDLPVVLWTSSSNQLLIEQGLAAGASAYHVKPGSLDAYRAEIDAILQRWLHAPAMAADVAPSKLSA